MAKTYQRADAYTIDQLKENIREMQAEKLARDARLEALTPLVEEHAQLLNEQNHEGMGTNCLLAMRSILGLKLMRRELGEPD